MALFGPYNQRITQVLGHFDTAVLVAVATQVSSSDADLPLRPEEHTA
jgi:hypothetical protein